jgi:hypothetical protein
MHGQMSIKMYVYYVSFLVHYYIIFLKFYISLS